jgi:hypothetical protein
MGMKALGSIQAIASRAFSNFGDPSTYQFIVSFGFGISPESNETFLGSLSCKQILKNVSSRPLMRTVTIEAGSRNTTRKIVLNALGKQTK